jgi:hypothetical protein
MLAGPPEIDPGGWSEGVAPVGLDQGAVDVDVGPDLGHFVCTTIGAVFPLVVAVPPVERLEPRDKLCTAWRRAGLTDTRHLPA